MWYLGFVDDIHLMAGTEIVLYRQHKDYTDKTTVIQTAQMLYTQHKCYTDSINIIDSTNEAVQVIQKV